MNTINFKTYNRKVVFSELEGYCSFNRKDKGDYIEIVEWSNGEGFDIEVHDVMGYRKIPITYGEFKLIKKLVKYLNKK